MTRDIPYMIAKQKLAHYCSYQERTIAEVENKLQEYTNLSPTDITQIIQELIQEKFLDERRYVISFVRGKFYIKKWGKNKITHALKIKKLDTKLIQEALEEIPDEAYQDTVKELLLKKKDTFRETNKPILQKKLINYLLQKGYEIELIREHVEKILYQKTTIENF
jgi:regulatory protein